MNDRDIKQLSASKLPNELDHFYFAYRVHNTKYFTSVDEVLEWLDKILLNKSKPLNPDYSDTLGPTIPATDDILRINILDECICSLCSELFRQYYRKDFDFIADIVEKLRQFIYTCSEYHDYFIHPTLYMLENIVNIYGKKYKKYEEENISTKLSRLYYRMMFLLYDSIKIKNQYVKRMMKIYRDFYNDKSLFEDRKIDIASYT